MKTTAKKLWSTNRQIIERKDSRLWQLEMRRSFPLKDAVDKDAILAVADHIEVGLLVMDLNVSARYE